MMTFGSTRTIALALVGASAIALATPADAAWRGRNVAIGAGIGLAAGALIGGAIASSAQPRGYYYGDGYYGGPYASYGYEPSYTYSEPVYESYGYYAPAPSYYYGRSLHRRGVTGMTRETERNQP